MHPTSSLTPDLDASSAACPCKVVGSYSVRTSIQWKPPASPPFFPPACRALMRTHERFPLRLRSPGFSVHRHSCYRWSRLWVPDPMQIYHAILLATGEVFWPSETNHRMGIQSCLLLRSGLMQHRSLGVKTFQAGCHASLSCSCQRNAAVAWVCTAIPRPFSQALAILCRSWDSQPRPRSLERHTRLLYLFSTLNAFLSDWKTTEDLILWCLRILGAGGMVLPSSAVKYSQ